MDIKCIADALILLLKEKPAEKIPIDEIVKRAGVGRATYFRSFHFDLNNAQHFFEYNYSVRQILEIVYRAGLQGAVHESFYQIMLTMGHRADARRLYREKFYAHGLYGLLDEWVKRGFGETPGEMARMFEQILSTPYTEMTER